MRSKLFAGAAIVAVCAALSLAAQAQTASCSANDDWFPHAKTPEPDSADFPEGLTKTITNCSFHKWSWNAFLWLTQDVGGEPRFLHFTETGIETVNAGIETKSDVADPLIGRAVKARALNLIDQAGPDGIMVDQQGRAIYYSIHSNKTFGDFLQQNGLLDPAKLRAFSPTANFPAGAMTLKAAWKVVAPDEDVSTFYTRDAEIAKLAKKDGKITLSGETEKAKVALVGFHVAGVVKGHPEMIWATFEHKDNAPDLPKPVNDMTPNEKVSDKNWTFYKANTPFKDCNINSAGSGALTLDESRQTLSPVTQVCRIIPYGGGNKMNVADIMDLNGSVHGQLKDVWNNYFEVGAIWFSATDALKPNCNFQPGALQCPAPGDPVGILTGSTQLSNATVETFTQSQSAQDNCFACHNTVQVPSQTAKAPALPGLNVDISHVLINEYFKAASK